MFSYRTICTKHNEKLLCSLTRSLKSVTPSRFYWHMNTTTTLLLINNIINTFTRRFWNHEECLQYFGHMKLLQNFREQEIRSICHYVIFFTVQFDYLKKMLSIQKNNMNPSCLVTIRTHYSCTHWMSNISITIFSFFFFMKSN